MEKLIVWFIPENKKIQLRQFHTEAENASQAIENLKKNATFTFRIMGVSGYGNLGSASQEKKEKDFVNNSFY